MKNTAILLFVLISFNAIAQEIYKPELTIFAESNSQWTGIAIDKNERVFVNFPRWSAETPISVAEIINGKTIPFPNLEWNNWDSSTIVQRKFICVQSVYVDNLNILWVLDTGYELQKDNTKKAHLYGFNLTTNTLEKEFVLPIEVISAKSYLNDFRIDNQKQIAYFTDSQVGGIVILDMKTNEIRRILAQHKSTLTEVEKIVVEGYERKHPVHSDGIELDAKKQYLYYSSLMGENVYRIPTKVILNKNLTDVELGKYVEKFAKTGANDGIIFDKKGNLYLTSLEKNAISKVDKKGYFTEIISNEDIKWPDSFAFNKTGDVLFTTSQIHIPREKRGTYKIFKLRLKK
jgi:sugar lactone lactonase YvrE